MSELKPCPCPICGATLKIHGPEDWSPTLYDPDSGGDPYEANCDCGFRFSTGTYDYAEFVVALNRRAQPDHIGDATAMVAQPDNAPLTLEELRGMDGEPVWIEVDGRPDLNEYCMVRRTDIGVIAIGAAATTVYGDDGQLVFKAGTYYDIETGNLYGVTWLAHHRKPEPKGGDRGCSTT